MSASAVTPALANMDSYLFNHTKCHGKIQMIKLTIMLEKRSQTHLKASMLMLGLRTLFVALSIYFLMQVVFFSAAITVSSDITVAFCISMRKLMHVKIIERTETSNCSASTA